MAEIKNNFLKSKMNKDLDDRLIPMGEYRHAQNISVSKSESQDVGALENILGNDLISSFTIPTNVYNLEIIGNYMDVRNDRIIVFMTNYIDTSGDGLSNFSPRLVTNNAYHAIGVYDIKSNISSIIVTGRFLNFSKRSEIYGIDMIDDLLFWTDNRNQPRKINVQAALTDNTYYITEDTISVSKYYPYQTIDLVGQRVISSSVISGGTDYIDPAALGPPGEYTNLETAPVAPSTGTGLTIDILSVGGSDEIVTCKINTPGTGYATGDRVTVTEGHVVPGVGTDAVIELTTETTSTMLDVVSDNLPDGSANPYRQPYGSGDITWKGDPEYLKDKFVRFSYRFKFDDGEYSLIAPFTQTCFIPQQDGYFIGDDDSNAYQATDVEFMQNKVNDITLLINSPTGNWNNIFKNLKVEEVDILYKEAGNNNIKVVDTITSDQLSLISAPLLTYNYISNKPWKTLPDSETLRVHDQVPVRALAQSVAGNRIIYGNYIDKPTPPSAINYSCNVVDKVLNTQIEYQNHNLKQNRTYQVGVVLSDRYGRQSTVILSSLDKSNVSSTIKGSTIFHEFKKSPFSSFDSGITNVGRLFQQGGGVTAGNVWDGDALNVTFWDTISSIKNNNTGEPGIYSPTNPLGWYSYKIVVKQPQQDYYNIYFPGILNGFIDGDTPGGAATASLPTSHFALHGDNINKVPRDLSLIGPNQKTFRSGRPSAKEDPDYYKFNISNGSAFSEIDMSSETGSFKDNYGQVSTQEDRRRLLNQRDREKGLDAGSQITNASIKLSLRLNNAGPDLTGLPGLTLVDTTTHQAYPGTAMDTVVTIGTGQDLGLWNPSSTPPYNTANVFFGYKNNPLIAKLNMSDISYGLVGPHPDAGRFNFFALCTGSGSDYALSNDVLCEIPSPSGAGVGFKVNIVSISTSGGGIRTSATTPTGNGITISDIGMGWDMLAPGNPAGIPGCAVIGGGNGTARFNLSYIKSRYDGYMAPSLSVYETEPIKSNLDIYWETSTYGLIDDLNANILDGDTVIPVSFGDNAGDPVIFAPDSGENIDPAVGSGTLTSGIYAINNAGNPITGLCTFTLLSVRDGYNNDRTNNFTISPFAGATNNFAIRLSVIQMCDYDQFLAENFTFTVNAKVPSATYATDGSFIDKALIIGPLKLANIQPEFVTPPAPALTGSINGGLIHTFNAVNGSVVGGGLETKSITFTLTDASGNFYLNTTTTDGEVQLKNNAAAAGAYPIVLTTFDGGGMSASFTGTVTLS
tara:strand:+ start:185 stop:3934 length:3750 start_codon:yes stop_codon:yes gene_type:complete